MEAVSTVASRFIPSKKAVEVLSTLAKSLPKSPIRNYAEWIGIRNGMAAITHGFALLVFHSAEFEGIDLTLDRNLMPTGTKFPAFEGTIQAKGKPVPNVDALVELASAKGKAFGKTVFLRLCGESVSLVHRKPEKVFQTEASYFNPLMIGDYVRAMPKGFVATGAWLSTEDQLLIEFSKNHGDPVVFTLIAVTVR